MKVNRETYLGMRANNLRAITFYRRNGFEQVSPQQRTELLTTYWSIPERQIETSVVLAKPPL